MATAALHRVCPVGTVGHGTINVPSWSRLLMSSFVPAAVENVLLAMLFGTLRVGFLKLFSLNVA